MMKESSSAWNYFMEHHDNIKDIVDDYSEKYRDQWDDAVTNKDVIKLDSIMNNAWFHAPDSRDVYHIPGFTEMCNLLDETVPGFIPDELKYGDEQ